MGDNQELETFKTAVKESQEYKDFKDLPDGDSEIDAKKKRINKKNK